MASKETSKHDSKEHFSHAYREIIKEMHHLLENITVDLQKSENGNKAASQRVRTGTVRLEKVAKRFRKESIVHEKKNRGGKKVAAKSSAKKAHAPAKAPAKTAAKAKTKTLSAKPRHLALKRSTAKIPQKRAHW